MQSMTSLSLSLSIPIINHSWQILKITYMSFSLLLQQCLVHLTLDGSQTVQGLVVTGHTTVVWWGVVTRIGSKQWEAVLCSSYLTFSSCILFASMWCIYTVVFPWTKLGKKSHLILSKWSDFHMINNLSTRVYVFTRCMVTSLFVDKILLLRYMNWPTDLRGLSFKMEMAPFGLRHMNCFIGIYIEVSASCCFAQGFAVEIQLGELYL